MLLSIEHVNSYYGQTQALSDISFSLQQGELLSIIGPNGSGKTTLLKAIHNILPFTGSIILDNRSVNTYNKKELASKIALLSQIQEVHFDYSIYDTVMLGRYAHFNKKLFSLPQDKDKDIVLSALKAVRLIDLKDRTLSTLSGGQLQRVFLAKTIAQDPDIILLDEPTNHLDLRSQIELINFLKNWAKNSNKSIIGVIHDINLALHLSENILLLDKGVIKAFGPWKNELSSGLLQEVYEIDICNYMLDSLALWKNFL